MLARNTFLLALPSFYVKFHFCRAIFFTQWFAAVVI
jgi:hypothetical protein